MKSSAVFAVLGLAGAAFALPAAAQMRSPSLSSAYVGANIGQSKFKDACTGVSDCDNKDTAFKLFGGYQFTPNIAAELGYTDLGKAKAGGESLEGTAWELSAIGMWPLASQFSLLGRLGGYHGELKATGLGASDSKTKNGLTWGLGAQYDLSRNVGLRAEWQRFNNMGGDNIVETHVDVLSLGALYRFQ